MMATLFKCCSSDPIPDPHHLPHVEKKIPSILGDVGVEPGYLCFFVNPLGDSDMQLNLGTISCEPTLKPPNNRLTS